MATEFEIKLRAGNVRQLEKILKDPQVAGHALEKLRDKMSGDDMGWLAAMSAACSIGIFGYLNANQMVSSGPSIAVGPTVAVLTGALSMMGIGRFIVPKHPKLAEYSLGIAMIVGIACAILYDFAVA